MYVISVQVNTIFRCTHYPEIFELDKSVCKEYFRQFGKVLRVIFKPRQRAIVIQYINKNDYFNALAGPSEYEGHPFKLEPVSSSKKAYVLAIINSITEANIVVARQYFKSYINLKYYMKEIKL